MQRISRRTVLAAGAAAIAAPAPALAQRGPDIDVAIVGAGAAGIAAARRVAASGRRCLLLEAADRVGGRCFTETTTFGVPYDRGARTIHMAAFDPAARLASAAGLSIYSGPPGPRLRIGRRFAHEGELEAYYAAMVRARRAIEDAASEERDAPAGRALPRDFGDWRATAEFVLGPLRSGKNLDEVSVQDLARSAQPEAPSYCREGYGALIARLAAGLPLRLSSPVRRIAIWRGACYLETPSGTVHARTAIVTAPPSVLAAGKIRFDPALPNAIVEAAAKLSPGLYERVALELEGNPLGLGADAYVLEKTSTARTAALLANASGTALSFVDVAGRFGRSLSTQGEAAMRAFAVDWLAGLFGDDVKKAVRRTHVTQWNRNPWALGSFSVAAPGSQGARAALTAPVRERIFFAGEATHETHWGTVGGAWETGDRAAEAALKQMRGGRR